MDWSIKTMEIHSRLKIVRKKQGVNQIPFARLVGVSQSAYANYERGATDVPISLAQKICKDFSVSADWLLLGNGAMEAKQLGSAVEEAVCEMRQFMDDNDLRIPPDKQGKIARFLFEEKTAGRQIDAEFLNRISRTVA